MEQAIFLPFWASKWMFSFSNGNRLKSRVPPGTFIDSEKNKSWLEDGRAVVHGLCR